MPMFRKRPIEIEAVPVRQVIQAWQDNDFSSLPEWVSTAVENDIIEFSGSSINIVTLEGTMVGDIDDWMIQGVEGELYPCKPDIFEKSYQIM
jgi:hypothetical protein